MSHIEVSDAQVEALMLGLGKPVESLLSTDDVARHLGTNTNAVRKLRCNLGAKGGDRSRPRQMQGWVSVPGVSGKRIHPHAYLSQIDPALRPQVSDEAA